MFEIIIEYKNIYIKTEGPLFKAICVDWLILKIKFIGPVLHRTPS